MKTGCHKKEITGSVQEKNGDLYISLNLYIDGKRKPKMINTGLSTKGYHLREAHKLKELALNMLNAEGATLDEVMDAVEGARYKKRRAVKVVKEKKTPIFMKPDIIEEMSSLLPPLMERGKVATSDILSAAVFCCRAHGYHLKIS